MTTKPIRVCFDLDGVIAKYDGWKQDGSIGEPNLPIIEFMRQLKKEGYYIIIQTCRTNWQRGPPPGDQYYIIYKWLYAHEIPYDRLEGEGKAMAHVYFDDRAVHVPSNGGDPELLRKEMMEILGVSSKQD